ncbi:suppressor of fused domain protein [Brevibacillus fluminis]|uniref:Suppressor of fused domain protein n=1 Tax=Brevibacillus fluminis TaxID=511487 RepID=A0A3M8DCV2_9BACL|nr:suppressor of fused domain protein [Brevibacillus fluminis]
MMKRNGRTTWRFLILTAAHIVIMILFAIAMIYYTIKWQKRRNDASAPGEHTHIQHKDIDVPEAHQKEGEQRSEGAVREWAEHEEKATVVTQPEQERSIPEEIVTHYMSYFHTEAQIAVEEELKEGKFAVLQFPPVGNRAFWVSATCGLSMSGGVELILYSAERESGLAVHLADVATQASSQFAQTGRSPQSGLAFALQSPIVPDSALTYLYVSHPLFEDESFSHFTDGQKVVRFLMLHAISPSEHEFLQSHGPDALETLFVHREVNSIDFFRAPAIEADSNMSEKD